ncbi:hypothetical protein ACFVR2_23170 [Gottfriedia sp. NPDC057991]|uniref:hypothetical protein n=1 Tax=Gottfriedia sp. NPDC057991 TaxID=3346298 RepID=UPI0036DE7458
MLQKFEKRNQHKFWKWFSKHEEEFLNMNENNYNKSFYKIHKYLEKFSQHLGFEYIKESTLGKKEFVITANGNIHLFNTVYELINGAPIKLKDRWIFTALRQPIADEILIYFDDFTISSKISFTKSKNQKWKKVNGISIKRHNNVDKPTNISCVATYTRHIPWLSQLILKKSSILLNAVFFDLIIICCHK